MINPISNSEDVIDSRDVIARIEELEAEREDLASDLSSAEEELGRLVDEPDIEALQQVVKDASSAMAEWDASEGEDLSVLKALAEEASTYAADWHYGEALIRDSYFEDYARELAEDCGMVKDDATWPNNCIDWEEAARQLRQDYTAVEFDGVTYWIR